MAEPDAELSMQLIGSEELTGNLSGAVCRLGWSSDCKDGVEEGFSHAPYDAYAVANCCFRESASCVLSDTRIAAIEELWRLELLINRRTSPRTVGGQFSILISPFRSV
jgi:hypothetical protein